jgi:hypothetical protein
MYVRIHSHEYVHISIHTNIHTHIHTCNFLISFNIPLSLGQCAKAFKRSFSAKLKNKSNWIWINMYLFTCISCTHVYMNAYINICIDMYKHVHLHICTYVKTYTYIHKLIHKISPYHWDNVPKHLKDPSRLNWRIRIIEHEFMYMFTCIHIYMSAYIYVHVHTCTCFKSLKDPSQLN